MTLRVACPTTVVSATIDALRESGTHGNEGIVLWLGQRRSDHVEIVQAYVPEHSARHDMFHIPPSGMKKLQTHLRAQRWMIGAQVHSHPGFAFHSRADDDWAIVRHVGALSIVAPYFARHLTPASFLADCSTYELDQANRWRKIRAGHVTNLCEILP